MRQKRKIVAARIVVNEAQSRLFEVILACGHKTCRAAKSGQTKMECARLPCRFCPPK